MRENSRATFLKVKRLNDEEIEWDSDRENGKKIGFGSDIYNLLYLRYLDTVRHAQSGTPTARGMGFNLNTQISEIEMEKINADYLEKNFRTVVPILVSLDEDDEAKNRAIQELSDNFGRLTAKQQTYASKILQDIRAGVLIVKEGEKYAEYIREYMERAKAEAIREFCERYGIDVVALTEIIDSNPDETSLNSGMRLNELMDSCDIEKTRAFYGNASTFKARGTLMRDLKEFILEKICEV